VTLIEAITMQRRGELWVNYSKLSLTKVQKCFFDYKEDIFIISFIHGIYEGAVMA